MTTTTTNTTTNTIIDLIYGKSRAERRRISSDLARAAGYAKSKFIDISVRLPFIASEQHKPFTAEEITQRAIERRDYKRAMQKMVMLSGNAHSAYLVFDNCAPHANRGTAPRKHADRRPDNLRRKEAYLRGLANNAYGLHADGKQMPLHYLNGRNQRYEFAPMAMAA